jgi:hypothetical protein
MPVFFAENSEDGIVFSLNFAMKRYLFIVFLVIVSANCIKAQNWLWDTAISDHTGAIKLCKDPWNYIYSYNPEAYVIPQNFTTIKKISPQGYELWQLDLPVTMQITSMTASIDSTIFLAGNFTGTFALGANTYISKATDVWIANYTSSGALLWCKTISSKKDDYFGEICMSGTDLVMTGSAGDTLNFMGAIFSKHSAQDLFLAKTNALGIIQGIKFTAIADTQTIGPAAYGLECDVDPWGNIYVLASSVGISQVDTFHIGISDSYHQPYSTKAIIKFNSQMQVQYVHGFGSCNWICTDSYRDITVNAVGECYFLQTYSYGQSGSDDMWTWINRLNSSGVLTNTFQPRPDHRSYLFDLELDKCGNVYYTGYHRDYINSQVNYGCLINGQLSSSLTSLWMRQDSSATNWTWGPALAVLSSNDLFITGFFSDTLQLANTLINTNNYYGRSQFYAELKNTASSPCAVPNITTTKAQVMSNNFSFYPNPCSTKIYLDIGTYNSRVDIYSCNGKLISAYEIKDERAELDVSALSEGLYFISVKNAEGDATVKVLVQK